MPSSVPIPAIEPEAYRAFGRAHGGPADQRSRDWRAVQWRESAWHPCSSEGGTGFQSTELLLFSCEPTRGVSNALQHNQSG
jgi:hypothetical protein